MAQFIVMGIGTVVNAVTFGGSTALFTMLSTEESEDRSKAMTQLQIDSEK